VDTAGRRLILSLREQTAKFKKSPTTSHWSGLGLVTDETV
jgi:hypothetical protein